MNIYRGIKFSRYCYGGKQARNLILLAIFFMMARPVPADDTELYVYESSSRTGDRPQILIIFDNSRSMEEYVYDVDESYSGVEGLRQSKYRKRVPVFYQGHSRFS
ncbi:hypothetical protein [Shewanella algae]|uniref:hypothetical protein n=1 Tax=Shewanella algae TaxID=38313 RepID=UPI001C811CCE|nr:hypothetical protein [Shewanella algae]